MSNENTSSIPVMRKPVDLLSNGLNSNNLASAAVQRHPIDRMQRGAFRCTKESTLVAVAVVALSVDQNDVGRSSE